MNNFEPTEDIGNYKWGIFYFNYNDSRIIVPKRARSLGWTLNFAKPQSYAILLLFFILVFVLREYRSH